MIVTTTREENEIADETETPCERGSPSSAPESDLDLDLDPDPHLRPRPRPTPRRTWSNRSTSCANNTASLTLKNVFKNTHRPYEYENKNEKETEKHAQREGHARAPTLGTSPTNNTYLVLQIHQLSTVPTPHLCRRHPHRPMNCPFHEPKPIRLDNIPILAIDNQPPNPSNNNTYSEK